MKSKDRLTALWFARPFLQGLRRLIRWSSESRGKEESDERDGEAHVEGQFFGFENAWKDLVYCVRVDGFDEAVPIEREREADFIFPLGKC